MLRNYFFKRSRKKPGHRPVAKPDTPAIEHFPLWEQGRKECIQVMESWVSDIFEAVKKLQDELASVVFLKWTFHEPDWEQHIGMKGLVIVDVIVLSGFTGEPLRLICHGIREDDYVEPDMSRAITEPEVVYNYQHKINLLRWEEIDDGRIGRITIKLGLKNATQWDKQQGAVPEPFLLVDAHQIIYDFYQKEFIEGRGKTGEFNEGEDAFDVFRSVVYDNIAEEQMDVRGPARETRSHGKMRFGLLNE